MPTENFYTNYKKIFGISKGTSKIQILKNHEKILNLFLGIILTNLIAFFEEIPERIWKQLLKPYLYNL